MKVLQITGSGMEFFHEQVRIIRDLGIQCDVRYSHDMRGTHRDESLLRVISGHNPLYYAIRGSSLYSKVLRSSLTAEYDIIHVNSGLVAPLGLLQPQRPVVLTLWGDDLLGDRLGGYQPAITKFCAEQSDRVIVRSQEMKDALPCDATIIPSGVDVSKFRPIDSTEARDAVGWDTTARHVLFPYPPQREKKRYPLAKRTVETVNRSFDETVRLQQVYDADHDEMPLYYNAADVLLLPSLREGSPNTVKEAMACNLPVVSTDVGDVRERLGPVSNSHVCSDDSQLAEAIRSVLDSGERSDGREYVEGVRLERMGERILDIYESLLEETAGVSRR
ncbi:glycosyltransferase family 4 protein [Haloarcula salinisoli]|nr:glycosyltransferase family 4 protein [Halomicroarcula salinisoli]